MTNSINCNDNVNNDDDNNKDQKFLAHIQRGIETVQSWDVDLMLLAKCRALILFDILMPEIYSSNHHDGEGDLFTETCRENEYHRDDDVNLKL